MTAAEFLAWDQTQTVKHEFVGGEVFMMNGVAGTHNVAVMNLVIALRQHLRGSACRVYASDVKLRIEAADYFVHPDLMVTCSAADAADRLIKREPVLVVEVLSSSTAAFDRGDKFAAYRLLPSLRECLLVDVEQRRCELYRIGPDGLWVLHPGASGEGVKLACVDLSVLGGDPWAELEPETPQAAAGPG